MDPPARISLFGIPVDVEKPDAILERMVRAARVGEATRVFYVNAHIFNLALDDRRFHQVLRDSEVVLADGYGARLAARWLRQMSLERVAITDYIWDFARLCAANGLRVFIVAGHPGVAERAAERLVSAFPTLKVVGVHHGYVGGPGASEELVREIRDAQPDVLCVGMGSPRQETWIQTYGPATSAPLLFAIGAVMDFVSGDVERPRPQWMSDRGLEWTGRLLAEPRRMWRRYLIGHPRFIYRTLRESVRQALGRTGAGSG